MLTASESLPRAIVQSEDEAIKTIKAIFPKAEITARAVKKQEA